jgi:hypothetical protein
MEGREQGHNLDVIDVLDEKCWFFSTEAVEPTSTKAGQREVEL